jgi:signal transduction histidine kinase
MGNGVDKLDHAERLLEHLESVEEQLRQLQEGLTRSHRLATLGTMASIIAHEFNNILTPVLSYCQMALQSPGDAELMKKAVEKSLRGAQRAAQISSSMLGFARDSDGQQVAHIPEVVTEVFSCIARAPEKDGIQLTLRIPQDAWVTIPPVNLQQVLLNLVLNARQAMRRTGGELKIVVTQFPGPSPADRRTVIDVVDTGPGIPADILPQVFQPFVTRREEAIGQPKGTGLGLTISRELVQRVGGTLAVSATGPGGTTFRIELLTATPPPAVIETDSFRSAG